MKFDIPFTYEDYENYISNKISISNLAEKYGCTYLQVDYRFRNYMKQNGFINRRTKAQNNRDDHYFDSIDTPNKAYILGFYLADGCISSNRLSFGQVNEDADILIGIKNEIYPESNIRNMKEILSKKTGYISKPSKTWSIYSIPLCSTLKKYFGERKTYNEHTIKNIIPKNLMFDFIRGYFDGDGCISYSHIKRTMKLKNGEEKEYCHINNQWFIISHTKNILDEICEYMNGENIKTNVFQEKRGGNYLISTSSYLEIKKLYDKLYYDGCICIKRKKTKFEDLIKEKGGK